MEEQNRIIWPGWETTRLIGRGSFGAVYEIERKLFEDDEPEKAALKVITIPQNDSDIEEMYNDGYDEDSVTSTFHTHLKSIVAEYSLMRKMNGSSNIVNCDDVRYVQHDDGIGWDIFIKMELLTPLAKAIPAEISEEQVIKIAKDMCAALELCQKHNIIHRDIKPQNIFVSENGDYKLGDFGIAKTVEKTMGGTKTGTYKYMAPEVYSNRPYNSTADIYSLGLVLYWMLNERRMPFMPLPPEKLKAGMDEEARNRRFSGEKIPAPKNGSDELKRIVLKACAFAPENRYQSATQLMADLNGIGGAPMPIVPFVADTVEEKSIPVADPNKDEATIGPIFNNATTGEVPNHDKTLGPVFDDSAIKEDADQDETVGPVFKPDENTELPLKKKKKVWPVIAALFAAVAIGSVFMLSRVTVAGLMPDQNNLEKHLLDGYSAIGCYEVNTMLPIGSTSKVEIEVGETYNNHAVLITGDTVELPIAATVIDGKVTVELVPNGIYLLQMKTDAMNKMNWSDWDTELPESVLFNSDKVQADIIYCSRQKNFATSGRDTMDGWELYDTFTPDAPYGEWSEWTENELTGDEYLEVEEQKQYRSREKEFTSSNTSTMDGWTQYDSKKNYTYGGWSSWGLEISSSATVEVEKRTWYQYPGNIYHDGVFYGTCSINSVEELSVGYKTDDFIITDNSSLYGVHRQVYVAGAGEVTSTQWRSRTKTHTSTTYYFSRWTDWSDWGTDPIEVTDHVEVEEKSLYRSRDIYGEVGYRFWKWSEWSNWVLEKPIDGEGTEMQRCVAYRYIS